MLFLRTELHKVGWSRQLSAATRKEGNLELELVVKGGEKERVSLDLK